jgi:ribosomal protein L11 methyltransferase
MNYLELIIVAGDVQGYEILIAELSEVGFDSFTEEEGVLKAYILESEYAKDNIEGVLNSYKEVFQLSWQISNMPNENWNAVWETQFEPVVIDNQVYICAPFHEQASTYPHTIVIDPEMSFGTGHHPTTACIMKIMLGKEWVEKKVLDFGTGTGILAILAEKLGASVIWADDYDPQCIKSATNNLELNNCKHIQLVEGDINAVNESMFDVIIGNITRNIICTFLPNIADKLISNGVFIASGFYENDLEIIQNEAVLVGLHLDTFEIKEGWCAASFIKQ